MRILSVTPISVSTEELHRRQDRYNRLCPPGINIRLMNLGDDADAPVALQTSDDVSSSEEALFARFAAEDPTGFDAFMPDCVLDPCVDVDGPDLALPVLGLLKLNAHHFAGRGLSVGAIVRNQAIGAEFDRKFSSYGTGDLVGGAQVLGLSVEDISDDTKWGHAVTQHLGRMDTDVVVNGCSAVEVSLDRCRPLLVDPTALALALLSLPATPEESSRR